MGPHTPQEYGLDMPGLREQDGARRIVRHGAYMLTYRRAKRGIPHHCGLTAVTNVPYFTVREVGTLDRFRKRGLLQTVAALIRANDYMGRAAAADPQEATEVLAKCQKAAIQMGTVLESMGEEHIQLVRLLEDYCENIYQMSVSFSDEVSLALREKDIRKLSKKNRRHLMQLQNDITYTIPDDRKEVVFLPYKASMWDSFESVWEAAEADENTDAYVIPVPYYDKNPDESFREEHYEGELFPDYVPVTRYDEYDFQRRRPDVIFIHNPYDECNIVTSVHPFFYSENLKEYTEKLVYIPYFVLDEVDPDNDKQVEGIKHLVIQPALFHSDKVVVQSEAMKKAYIRILLKQADQPSGEIREYWEEKILGLGSPKVDKVLNTRKDKLEIPEEWKEMTEKPEGGRKKVVFYNTSVGALLRYDGQYLEKMKEVFDFFYQKKEEITLLWRPHPLIEATIQTMRPQLWEEYRVLRDNYRQGNWGIYDDTPDMNQGIALSNIYYGDRSSIVELYKKMGKLAVIQRVGA